MHGLLRPRFAPRQRRALRWLASDTFERADSGTVGATNGLWGGQREPFTWSEINGTFAISSNKLALAASQSTARCGFDSGSPDIWMRTIVRTDSSGSGNGLLLRHEDANNEWRVIYAGTAGNVFRLISVVSASVNVVADPTPSPSLSINTDYEITAVAYGSTIYADIRNLSSGVKHASFLYESASAGSDQSTHGVFGNTGGGNTTLWDRIQMRVP